VALTIEGSPNSANATSVTIPTHTSGDLIVIFAYRNSSTTVPSKPSASGNVPTWTDIDAPSGADSNSCRTAYAVGTGTTTSGTWTNATYLIAVVLRGQDASPIGGHAESGSTSTTQAVAPSVTMTRTDGTSQLLHFMGHRAQASVDSSDDWASPPAGYTQQEALWSSGIVGGVLLLTKNTTTSDGSVTNTIPGTGTAVGYRGATVEILAPSTKSGSASGSYTFAGSASGARTPKGSSTGNYTFAGAATGARDSEGSGSGSYTFSATAAGESDPQGSASGAYTWSGTAIGQTPDPDNSTGSAAGNYNFAGSATGARQPKGSADGAYTWAGSAAGKKVPAGSSSGTYAFAGSAAGERESRGSASGNYGWAGIAISIDPTMLPTDWEDGNTEKPFTNDDANATADKINDIGAGTFIIPENVLTSASVSLTLTTEHTLWVYTGTATSEWTMPTDSPGAVIRIINRSVYALTVFGDIYSRGAPEDSIVLAAGVGADFVNDGTYWLVG
jgi:hypothetical protein